MGIITERAKELLRVGVDDRVTQNFTLKDLELGVGGKGSIYK